MTAASIWEMPGVAAWMDDGRAWLREGARRAITRHGAGAIPVELLDDAALLDPRVHAYFYLQPRPCLLEQLLIGHVPDDARPRSVMVVADARGIVHIPGVGSFAGLPQRAMCELRWDGGWSLDGGPRQPRAPRRAGKTSIELDDRGDPCLTRVLAGDQLDAGLLGTQTAAQHAGALTRALGWLTALEPTYSTELCRDARVLRLFRSRTVRSCANLSAYGAAFLQCDAGATPAFFAEDLAHQVGHISCYALTADPRSCFAVPPGVPVRELNGDASDPRCLCDAFHGNFTMGRMVAVLDALSSSGAATPTPLEHTEIVGRLALALRRFRAGLESIDEPRLYTERAWAAHCAWWEIVERLEARHSALLQTVDLSGQPYVFSWPVFRTRNGVRAALESFDSR